MSEAKGNWGTAVLWIGVILLSVILLGGTWVSGYVEGKRTGDRLKNYRPIEIEKEDR